MDPYRPSIEPAPAPDEAPEGMRGPFHAGPLIGIGAPNLLSFGLTSKLTRYFGLGVNFGLIPTLKFTLYGPATLSYQEYDVYARVYPFGGGFFLGAGVGYETVNASLTTTVSVPAISGVTGGGSLSASGSASVRSLVLTPQIGYFYTFPSGFSLGLDVGAQVPLSAGDLSVSTSLPAAVPVTYSSLVTDPVSSTLSKIGQQVIPTLNLRIGWLF